MNQLLHHYLRTRGFPTPPKPTRTITTRQRGSIADQDTHIAKNELRTTLHQVTWHIEYRQ